MYVCMYVCMYVRTYIYALITSIYRASKDHMPEPVLPTLLESAFQCHLAHACVRLYLAK